MSGFSLAECKACRHVQKDSELYPWACEACGVRHSAPGVGLQGDVLRADCRGCSSGWLPPVTGASVSSVWACHECGVLHAVPTSGPADEPSDDIDAALLIAESMTGTFDVDHMNISVAAGIASWVTGSDMPFWADWSSGWAGWLAAAALENGDRP